MTLNQNIKQFVATGEKLFIGASVAVGMTVAVTAPAMAASITGAKMEGNNPLDHLRYDVNGTQTYVNQAADLDSLLSGDSDNPGGNLELFASSETLAGQDAFDANKTTSVSGKVGNQTLTLSSLNAKDWFTTSSGGYDTSYGANTLASRWFTEFYNNGVKDSIEININTNTFFGTVSRTISTGQYLQDAFNAFRDNGGFAATSDPNISYVYDDGNNIKVGLAGHHDLKAFYKNRAESGVFDWLADTIKDGAAAELKNQLPFLSGTIDSFVASFTASDIIDLAINDGFQASEVVKYTYGGNTPGYGYSFNATETGLKETDGWSHNGNYEVTITGGNSEEVPEPITGLIAAAALGGVALRRTKNSNKSKNS